MLVGAGGTVINDALGLSIFIPQLYNNNTDNNNPGNKNLKFFTYYGLIKIRSKFINLVR